MEVGWSFRAVDGGWDFTELQVTPQTSSAPVPHPEMA